MYEFENEPKEFMTDSFGDQKLDTSKQVNAEMSILPNTPDEYETKIGNIGGAN